MDEVFWDRMYRERGQVWSGEPNGALVAEVSSLRPGRALDVGCGEGADARWLAEHGWRVTGIDVSQVALDRAAAVPGELGVAWVRMDLADTSPERRSYDLVSAQYFPLPRQEQHTTLRGLLDAVAVGGTLLVATHDKADLASVGEGGPDPADYYWPEEIAALLDDTWAVLINETRPRAAPAPPGTTHTRDAVLVARRLL